MHDMHDTEKLVATCYRCDVEISVGYLVALEGCEGRWWHWVTVCPDHANGWHEGADFKASMYEVRIVR